MSTERGQGELARLLLAQIMDEYGEDRETWTELGSIKRITKAVQAHVDAEVAAALEGAAADFDRRVKAVDDFPSLRTDELAIVRTTFESAARIVREQIPTSGGGAV